jgi:hypothetical protein
MIQCFLQGAYLYNGLQLCHIKWKPPSIVAFYVDLGPKRIGSLLRGAVYRSQQPAFIRTMHRMNNLKIIGKHCFKL